jgi:hypothetical protein
MHKGRPRNRRTDSLSCAAILMIIFLNSSSSFLPQSDDRSLPEQPIEQWSQNPMTMEPESNEITAVKVEIAKVDGQIAAVKEEIRAVVIKVEQTDPLDKLWDFYADRTKHLQDQEIQLRQEKKTLREKEMVLLAEKKQSRNMSTTEEKSAVVNESALISRMDALLLEVRSNVKATPLETPSSFGKKHVNRLKYEGEYVKFTPVQNQPPILSKTQWQELQKQRSEHMVVAFVTPHLETVFGSAWAVVNSEENKWLKTSDDATYSQKPDLFVCHKAMYKPRDPFRLKNNPKASRALLKLRKDSTRFGILADWRLRMCIGLTLEAKTNITNRGIGEVINYGAHICFGDGPDSTRVLLFDKTELFLIKITGGKPSNITKCNWTDAGSRSLLQQFVLVDPITDILIKACNHYGLFVTEDAFLGAGAFGFVFCVHRSSDHKQLALKIVLDVNHNVPELEAEKALLVQAKSLCPDQVIGIEESGFFAFERGAVLLLSQVGKPYKSLLPLDILESLETLHFNGIIHGDARVENVLSCDGKPCWIDFRNSRYLGIQESPLLKKEDWDFLRQSIADGFSIPLESLP